MAFNVEAYLESIERDYDYYLFWAEEFHKDHFEDLCECDSLLKTQIACTHILMDHYDEDHYQEDGFILGEIIWASMQK